MDALPTYALRLDALHEALVDDFRLIIGRLPLSRESRVLDAGCGSGFFTSLLAERADHVIGLDHSEAFLRAADAKLADAVRPKIKLVPGDVRQLRIANDHLDVVWSGHSMQSYPELLQCLREFNRVLRPGGRLAVLETDNLHSVMLSWPPDLELAVRQAEHREIGDEDSYQGSYFPRFAERLFAEASFEHFSAQHVFIHRRGPADGPLASFVQLYLENLLRKTSDHLSEKMRARLAMLADPRSEKYLPRQKTFYFQSLQVLMLGQVPGEEMRQ
jgi:ubiquinone/menaquinone biosynthesis C-methylase UbiE